ncbi:MAG: helix-turn-helix domain-containing protein [Christensenellaceae bacterium]|nr:helix-turn-helix domain-containing protein [Christensenellaceae bacterium]
MTQKQVADLLGVRQQTVAAWEANRSTPCPDIICKLAELFCITTDQLLLSPCRRGELISGRLCRVPIVSQVRAGFEGHSEDELLGYEFIDGDFDADYVFVQVQGDSMQPQIVEGDLALVHRQEDVENGQLAVVIVDDEVGTLKRVYKQAGGLLLQPLNSQYSAQFFPVESLHRVRIFGKVIRTVRKW